MAIRAPDGANNDHNEPTEYHPFPLKEKNKIGYHIMALILEMITN